MKAVTKIIFLDDNNEKFFGEGPARLLRNVERTGSLRSAAISMDAQHENITITEETLYRGLLFQGLQRKNRALAYLVSVSVFAWIHVMGYVGQFDWRTLLLCFVQYLPAGIILALAYEKTDTIITPILIHIAVNQIGMSAMR